VSLVVKPFDKNSVPMPTIKYDVNEVCVNPPTPPLPTRERSEYINAVVKFFQVVDKLIKISNNNNK